MPENSVCPFCEFEDQRAVIYVDEFCFAAISRKPINKYHVMVIPKVHHENFVDLSDELVAHIFVVAKKISLAVRKACDPAAVLHVSDDEVSKKGYNLVSHYKFHIIPRFEHDSVVVDYHREEDPGIEARAEFAERIKNEIN